MTVTDKNKIMVSFKNVHKYFKDLHVINDVSLDIRQGEVVVVCGLREAANPRLSAR